jgi:glycerol-3-phosphate dehydrogenase
VFPRISASSYAFAYFDEAGRIVFLIPWGGEDQLTLVGTTDVDHDGGPNDVRVSAEEARYLTQIVKKLFPNASGEPLAGYSSLRPLLRDAGARSPTAASREHRIWNSEDGVLHVAGGKYTTYRAMSEEAADLITGEIAPALAGLRLTARTPVEGNSAERVEELLRSGPDLAHQYGLSGEEAVRTIRNYGVQARALFRLLPEGAPAGLSRLEAARIAFAARHEMARRLPDLLFISTYWGYERRPDREWLEPLARELGRHLGWDSGHASREIRTVLDASVLPEAA